MALKDYLSHDSKSSSMRLGFIIVVVSSCLTAFILGIMDIYKNEGRNLMGVAAIVGVLSGSGFYGKNAQYKNEKKES